MPEPSDCSTPSPTYEVDIRPIIESSCAYSGCHLDGNTSIYNNYEDLLPNIESGSFRDRVIAQRADETFGMPPNYAPEGRPTELTAEEVILIQCWLEAGHPQN